jgi:hypothetical protein
MRDAPAGKHSQYHTPHIRLTIEIDGVASVWDWQRGALIPMGPRAAELPAHTAFSFDILCATRRMTQTRWAGQPPFPLQCKDYADGEYICGLSAQSEQE